MVVSVNAIAVLSSAVSRTLLIFSMILKTM